MKLAIPHRMRYWVVNHLEGNPPPISVGLLRITILASFGLMAAPWQVAKELSSGLSRNSSSLKSALRTTLWVLNRSWIPFKFKLGTFFDIGWYLSAESCTALAQRQFISGNPLKRLCDLAQLKLAAVKAAVAAGDQAKILETDQKICSLVNEVLNESHRWAISQKSGDDGMESASVDFASPIRKHSVSFDNARTSSALLDFDNLCRSIGLDYFLISGTFLGVVRDGAFIGHDHDIDVGIFEENPFDDLLVAVSGSNNFTLNETDYICKRRTNGNDVHYTYMEKPAIIRLAHGTGISIDVFIHFRDGDLIWHGSSVHRWDNTKFELVDYQFLDHLFKGAKDFDRYLTENYGRDWRTPKQKFNVNFDTPNMSYVGTANAVVFFTWLIAGAMEDQDPRKVNKYIDLLLSLGILEIKESVICVR